MALIVGDIHDDEDAIVSDASHYDTRIPRRLQESERLQRLADKINVARRAVKLGERRKYTTRYSSIVTNIQSGAFER